MITDIIGTVEYVNPKFTETTGYTLAELAGSTSVMLSRECLPEDKYDSMWKDILSGKGWRGDLENIRKDGTSFWSIVSISPINNEYSELTHFVIVSEDVSELKDAHAKMEQLALYDELTGLPNRRQFFRQLTQLFRTDVIQSPAVVMLLDLDNFKNINDTQGHPAGDKLLIEVANRLQHNIPENTMAARLGGDEFAVLINPIKNAQQVDLIAQQLLKLIAKPFVINENEIKISTSIGLAWLPKDGDMPDTILKHADLAMYQAKEMGRNQYRQFTEQLHDQLQRYIRFSRELPEALANGDFYLCFQPKVDLAKKRIIGVEALIRWDHAELGSISPFDFISIAEDTGFIVPLGNWVFAEACRSMRKLASLGYPDISCAINISLRQFREPSLLGVIEKSMRDNGLDPRNIEVEITESLLMKDVDKAILTLREIQKLGISVAIDDFGTGYSSFSYLKNLPINVLKVDRCFIKDIPESQEDMKITSAIVSMAHSLNLKVVAEGIETDKQRQFLLEQNCDIGQGYLFGKAVGIDQLKKVLDQDRQVFDQENA
jgi:diguanylate cyclase (GGDEF)-like protein/PAS domain S-box-containing protein